MTDSLEAEVAHGSGRLDRARHALVHFGTAAVLLCLFAACDNWGSTTGWTVALGLAAVIGFVAGFATTTVLHEWFHLLGARLSGGQYDIPRELSFFVYDWKFEHNSVGQFFTMSIAGSVGGLLAVWLLALAVPTDNPARVALLAGAVTSFVFGSIIEWPVLGRTLSSGQPLEELAKINHGVLARALAGSVLAAALTFWWLG